MNDKYLIVFGLSLLIAISLPTHSLSAGPARLSTMGVDGDILVDVARPASAFSATSNRFLVVWQSDADGILTNVFDIFGQMVDATGAEVGSNDFRISFQGGDGDTHQNELPEVAWNPALNEFLVVWTGQVDFPTNSSLQIFGQRINAATGALIGSNFRVSTGLVFNSFLEPSVTFNRANNEYLVVWEAIVTATPLKEKEILGVRINAITGAVIGTPLRLTHHGADGDENFDAKNPQAAWNSATNDYLVVFEGTQTGPNPFFTEQEIYGQRVQSNGQAVGSSFRLSAMGPEGDTAFRPLDPEIVSHPGRSEYLVVWTSEFDPILFADRGIFGQRLNAAGSEIGLDDFRISQEADGLGFVFSEQPSVAWNGVDGSYLVTWAAPSHLADSTNGRIEVFGQRLDPLGGFDGPRLTITDCGQAAERDPVVLSPVVATNTSLGDFFVAWQGDHDTPPMALREFEIYGCNVGEQTGLIFIDGFESGDTLTWAATSP